MDIRRNPPLRFQYLPATTAATTTAHSTTSTTSTTATTATTATTTAVIHPEIPGRSLIAGCTSLAIRRIVPFTRSILALPFVFLLHFSVFFLNFLTFFASEKDAICVFNYFYGNHRQPRNISISFNF